ncbi:hypothetical protein RIF29_13617 [Crotalaria pallida]|uniref:Transmembrane protein n=1 Tax=Crotalaria pallida TaxID=3830 RepID=A0AAN9IPV7_CROPI
MPVNRKCGIEISKKALPRCGASRFMLAVCFWIFFIGFWFMLRYLPARGVLSIFVAAFVVLPLSRQRDILRSLSSSFSSLLGAPSPVGDFGVTSKGLIIVHRFTFIVYWDFDFHEP